MIKKMPSGECVLEEVFNYAGMSFMELASYFFEGPTGWGSRMQLIHCLRALDDEGLISVDGIEDKDIREFIRECECALSQIPNSSEEVVGRFNRPANNKIRCSDKWRRVRGALTEGLQYTSAHRTICYPNFGKPNPKREFCSDVFVAMPFHEDFNPVYKRVKDVASILNLKIKRADEFTSSTPIVSDIWSAICNTSVMIADCTGKNPNVFYEIGLAHAIGVQVILMAQDKVDIPFDIRHIRYLEYSLADDKKIQTFEQTLHRTISHCLDMDRYA